MTDSKRTIPFPDMRKLLIIALSSAAVLSCGGPEDDGTTTVGTSDPSATSGQQNPDPQPAMQPGELRNVLLVTFDTTRADHIGCYGSPNSSTPTLDYLAKTGVRFEQCISTAPITLPSHTSLLTGQYPYNHGVRNNGTHKLPDEAVTLAERLQEHGYETGAVISAMVLNSRYGLGQGFDHYDQNLVAGSFKNVYLARETPAADTIKRAKQWINKRGDKPFFLWVHLFDPHHPYTPPPAYAERTNGNPYDGELAYADEQFGKLLTALAKRDLLRHTLVVATGDHGESLGEHGESTHSIFLYDSATRVPLIFSHNKLRQEEVRQSAVSLVDIAPTILDLLQIPALETVDGQSLAAQLTLDQAEPDAVALEDALLRRVVYSESMLPYYNFGWAQLRSLRSVDGRYILAPTEELYALGNDPGERMNLIDEAPDQAAVFRNLMDNVLPKVEQNHQFSNFDDLPPAERAALIQLGYLSSDQANGNGGASTDPGVIDLDRPDPKEAVLYFTEQSEALELARARDPEAEAALREVLLDNPEELRCLSALADILVRTDRVAEALPMLKELAKIQGAGAMEILALSQVERTLDLPEWEEHFAAARAVDPEDPAPLLFLGDWSFKDGEYEEAIGFYEGALDLDPGNLVALIQIGTSHTLLRQNKKARAALDQALAINPDIYTLQLQLGLVADALGVHEEAVAFFKKATQLGPARRQAWRRYGSSLLRIQQPRQAVTAFDQAAKLGDKSLVTSKNLGMLQVAFGKHAQAIAPLRAALAVAADDWQCHLYLALALDHEKDEAGSKEHLATARLASAADVAQLAKARPDVAALLQKYPE
jgi:choline-sulfatase